MLHVEEWMDAKLLLKQGLSEREVARRTGLSRNTVARLADQPAHRPYSRPPKGSILDPFKPYLVQRFQACPLSAVRLLEEIRPMGYAGGVHLLREFLATLRTEQRRKTLATVRFETPPGEQAQVDWCHCGSFPDALGNPVKIYAFVMVLGFSRMTYAEFTPSMELPELLRCHENAFAFLGGWPRQMLYDNMAQVKLPHSAEWNPLFLDFAQHYGFAPRTCRVRRPRTKGKVERTIGYLEDNFLAGRSFADLADLNAQGRHWLDQTANVRVHATTGKRPVDLLPEEGLTPLAQAWPYPLARKSARKVSAEATVHLDRSTYSVPPEHVGKTVLVEQGEVQIRIHCGDLVIAEHRKAERPGQHVVTPEHAAALWQLSTGGSNPPPASHSPSFQVTFQQGVAATPLSVYEALA
jgi:transposase